MANSPDVRTQHSATMCHGCHDDLLWSMCSHMSPPATRHSLAEPYGIRCLFSISLHLCRLLAQAAAKKRSVWLCGDPHLSRFQRNPMKRLEHRSLTSSPDFVARKSAETPIRASRIADTKRWDLNGFDQGYRETSRDIECYFQ